MRQRQEDDVVTGQHVGRGRLEDPLGQRGQVRLEGRRAAGPRCAAAVTAPTSTPRVPEQQPQQLPAGVPAGAGDRDPDLRHLHDYTVTFIFMHTGFEVAGPGWTC